jgi:beta-propeller uncharacterized protein DUF5122
MSRSLAKPLLLAGLMSVFACAPSTARAGTADPANSLVGVDSSELPPLWQAESPTPRHHAARGRTTLAPFATSALPQDAAWEPWIAPGLTGNSPRAVEYHGKLYLTTSVAGRAVGGLVAWDGTTFDATPPFPGSALAIGVWNDRLVVATYDFSGAPAKFSILSLNGAAWDTLGHANSYVNAICAHGSDLVIGGQFTSVDGVPAKGVARFDGSTWTDLGTVAFTGTAIVYALCEHAGRVVMGGSIGAVKNIAIWDDVGSIWQTPGAGFVGSVKGLASDGVKLYATGDFVTPFVARAEWNGSTWAQIPTSGGVSDATVTVWNGGVVFKGGVPLPSRLAFWNGSVLTPMVDSIGVGSLTSGIVARLLTWNGKLVATGNFANVGTVPAPTVAIFDGVSWSAPQVPWAPDMLSPEGASAVTDLISWNGELIAGGSFALLAQQDHYVHTVGLGSWDGSNWSPLAGGVFANQRWFGTYQGDLVLTGWGAQATTPTGTARYVLRWNGTSWNGFGTPPFDFGFAVQEYHGDLYVGFDDFSTLDGIQRWNGSSWTTVGSGLYDSVNGGYAAGYALTTLGDSLAVGGRFDMAGGLPAANFAFWDGAAWHPAGAGFDDYVRTAAVWNGQLIAGGPFTHSGAQAVPGCAVWDGTSWQPFGTNSVEVEKLLSVDGMLFAAGDFRLPDDSVVETVARWDGSDWHVLGSGTNSYAIAVHSGYLYCGGGGIVHGHLSHGLSRIPLYATLDAPAPRIPTVALTASPNPSRSLTRFAFKLPTAGHARLTVVDLAGRIVATLADGPFDAGEHQARWTAAAPAGVYFARLEAPGGVSRVTRVVRFE